MFTSGIQSSILICYQTPVFGLMSEGTEKKLHYFFRLVAKTQMRNQSTTFDQISSIEKEQSRSKRKFFLIDDEKGSKGI